MDCERAIATNDCGDPFRPQTFLPTTVIYGRMISFPYAERRSIFGAHSRSFRDLDKSWTQEHISRHSNRHTAYFGKKNESGILRLTIGIK